MASVIPKNVQNLTKVNETQFTRLCEIAKESYTNKMREVIGLLGGEGSMDSLKLREFHEIAVESTMTLLLNARTLSPKQKNRVTQELDQELIHYFSMAKPTPKPKKLHLGVYINYNIFKIGIYQHDISVTSASISESEATAEQFKEILSLTPEIYFSDDGIIIGKLAGDFRNRNRNHGDDKRYYDIFELIASPGAKSLHHFQIKGNQYNFCTHEIIAAFFQKALSSTTVKIVNYGNMIVTIPFLPLSLITERIAKSFSILGLGFSSIRVLSTLVMTAVAHAAKTGYFKGERERSDLNSRLPGKYVIAVDIQRTSFSLGLVLLRPHWINLITSSRSYETKERQEDLFIQSHNRLYDGIGIEPQCRDHVQEIYRDAISRLFLKSKLLRKQSYQVIVAETSWTSNSNSANKHRSDLIVELIFEILKGNIHVSNAMLDLSPLEGASVFACSALSESAEEAVQDSSAGGASAAPYLDVDDVTRYFHILTTRFEGVDRQNLILSWKPLIFEIPFEKILLSPRSCIIELHQQYGGRGEWDEAGPMFQVCRYELVLECKADVIESDINQNNVSATSPISNFPTTVPLRIHFTVDPEGVYSLYTVTKASCPVKLTMTRKDFENCNSTCQNDAGSGFMKLIEYLNGPVPSNSTSKNENTQNTTWKSAENAILW